MKSTNKHLRLLYNRNCKSILQFKATPAWNLYNVDKVHRNKTHNDKGD